MKALKHQGAEDCEVPDDQDGWAFGPWCWLLDDVQPARHVPVRGRLGLWNLPDDVLNAARAHV